MGEKGGDTPAVDSVTNGHHGAYTGAGKGASKAKYCAFRDAALWALVGAFQDGDKASDFWNGDVAAAEGHLSLMLAKHGEDPLSYSHLAVSRAAKNGMIDVVAWLHEYADISQVPSAMDSAAAGGHLEVCMPCSLVARRGFCVGLHPCQSLERVGVGTLGSARSIPCTTGSSHIISKHVRCKLYKQK